MQRRGADIDSDHHLVVAENRLKVAVARAAGGPGKIGRRFDVSKLRDPGIRKTFQLELRNRISGLDTSSDSLYEERKRIKVAYTETSSVVPRHKTTHTRKNWMSQHTWSLIKDRRNHHLRLLDTRNDAMPADFNMQYRQNRREIYRSTRKDRRQWADDIADRAQQAAKTGNLKELYNATKTLAGNSKYKKKPLKSKDGQLIAKSEGQLLRWRIPFIVVICVKCSG